MILLLDLEGQCHIPPNTQVNVLPGTLFQRIQKPATHSTFNTSLECNLRLEKILFYVFYYYYFLLIFITLNTSSAFGCMQTYGRPGHVHRGEHSPTSCC